MIKRKSPLTQRAAGRCGIFIIVLCVIVCVIGLLQAREIEGALTMKYTAILLCAVVASGMCFMYLYTSWLRKEFEDVLREYASVVKGSEQQQPQPNRDELTGIRNRDAFNEEITRLDAKLKEGETEIGLARVDLNFMDTINSKYGFDKGNLSIKKLCHLICVTFEHSPVFRIGGDEFAIILKGQDYHNYDVLADTLNEEMQDAFFDDRLEPWERISAAIGAAFYNPENCDTFAKIYRQAEDKMLERKKAMKGDNE
ncbi:MAG: GGDEF domain-containing protein [Lachnospiraceae bacterium]|nr:GGDEF domain-containing protein [Lachnospiraceae bacterium]